VNTPVITRKTLVTALALFILLALTIVAHARELTDVRVYPQDIDLTTQRDRQSIVVQAIHDDGVTVDVTDQSTFTFADPKLVKMDGNVVHPVADGQTQLTIEHAGHKMQVPVTVKDSGADRPISFKLDVMPVFMKASCNTGSCHGAARGKDGFMLSLFGYDPDGDWFRITKEMAGRRINLALPRQSLLLEKGVGKVNHTGGELFKEDSELYNEVLRWLEAGAPKDSADVAKPLNIEVLPNRIVLEGENSTQRLVVRAKYSDGTTRDVTHLAAYITSNSTSATVDDAGVITAHQRGEAFVMARFETFTVGAQVLVIPKGLDFQWPDIAANNYIDELVYAKLKKLRMTPSELCSDEVFLRRAYIDIVGVLGRIVDASQQLDGRALGLTGMIDDLLRRCDFSTTANNRSP